MDLLMFACDRCDNLDSIYMSRSHGDGFLCYRCRTGDWHCFFEEKKYDPDIHRGLMNRVDPPVDDFYGEPSFS